VEAIVTEDVKVLLPNKEHQNFSETQRVIKKGTKIYGEPRYILGKRRGDEFVYRLFQTNKKELIFLDKTKPMEKTEVTLNASGNEAQNKTIVNVSAGEIFSRNKVIGLFVGTIAGFAYSKYKQGGNHVYKSMAIGAAIGYGTVYAYESIAGIVVKTTK
jgi:hypothetical protein